MDSPRNTGPPPLTRPVVPADESDAPRKTLLELASALQTRLTDRDLQRYLTLRRFFRKKLAHPTR